MTTITKINSTNIYKIQVGDVIEFLNRVNYPVKITVTRVEEKSCYSGSDTNPNANWRESWGTINGYIHKYGATVNGRPADYARDCKCANPVPRNAGRYTKCEVCNGVIENN